MKRFLLSLLLAVSAAAQTQPINVQKNSGTNTVANGPLVIGPGNSLTIASGGTITVASGATANFQPSTINWTALTAFPSPTFALTGDATGSVTLGDTEATGALTLAASGISANTYGSSTAVPVIVFDAKGRATSASNVNISPSGIGALVAANNLSDVALASAARTNLGLAIGMNVEAWSTNLDAFAAKTAPTGAVVGTNDTQTLTNKSIVASQLTGVLAAAQFPAMTGDVTNSASSLSTTVSAIDGHAVTLAGAFSTSGSSALTLTTTGATNVTLPTSGTLLTANQTITLSGDVTGSGTTAITALVGKIGGNAVSLGGALTTGGTTTLSGAYSFTGTLTGATSVTFPTSGTLLTGNQTITISGDASGSGSTAITLAVSKLNGTSLAGLATGLLKNTTSTGVPSIATAGTDYSPAAGDASIATVGTVTTGTWQATPIGLAYGGTGTGTLGGTNTLLYTTVTNTLAALATANNSTLVTSSGGVPSWATTLPTAVQNNITHFGAASGTSIDSTPIGAGTPAAGAFTTLSTTGAATVNGMLQVNSNSVIFNSGNAANDYVMGSSYGLGNNNYTELNLIGNVSAGNNAVDIELTNAYTGNLSNVRLIEAAGNLNIFTGGTTQGTGTIALQLLANQEAIFYGYLITAASGSAAALNIGGTAGDPASLSNGDLWYNSTTHKFRAEENGASVNLIGGGGGSGTVTSITAGTGLSGGTITTSGTISLASTAVSPGSYTSANITVNAQGQITAASNGSGGGGGVTQIIQGTGISISPAGGTGVVTINSSVSGTYTGYQYPESYGAAANGTTDDSVAIMDAYAACTSREALFLSGTYGIGTGAAILFNNIAVGVVSTPGAKFVPSASSPATNCITIAPGNYSSTGSGSWSLPIIDSFSSGTGLRIEGSALTINLAGISSCNVGIEFYINGAYGVVQDTVNVNLLANCTTSAIQLTRTSGASSPPTGIIEGNMVYANFVSGQPRWVYMPSSNKVDANSIIENYFSCSAFAGMNGASTTKMIDKEDSSQQTQNMWVTPNGIYSFSTGDYWVYSATTNGLDQSRFDFGPGSGTQVGYQVFTNPESSGGLGSMVINLNGGRYAGGTVACTTSTNTRSSFNGGTSIIYNRIPVSMAVSGLATGGTATFYAYSPFVNGNARLQLTPDVQLGSVSGMMVDSLIDNSGAHANEIKIILRNVSGSTVSATVPFLLTVGYP